jgi:UDP-N-acetylmuramoylalanine--D-glutamate ligase
MTRLERWRAEGVEVAVAGLGRSGQAALTLLAAHGVRGYGSDRGAPSSTASALAGPLTEIAAGEGGHDLARVARAATLVVSPGIPPDAPVVRAAVEAGIPILAEAQLGLEALGGAAVIAVTGTNGKTTTTALVDHLMRHAGRHSVAAGNIGLPLSAVAVMPDRPEWIAAELSSFQLHDMPDLRPAVGVLTNLAPDHLDRYPDLAAYYADKARLFANAHAGSIWVHNLDDADSRRMVEAVAGRHLAFSTQVRADAWYDRATELLHVGEHVLGSRDEFPLLGDHNVANLLAAALAVHASGVPVSRLVGGLCDVAAMPHRMEPVATVAGVRYINDSKATNLASTRVALVAMDVPYVLLLGGRHKGEPYHVLADALDRAVAVVAYGEAAPIVMADLDGVVPRHRVETLDEAVALAASLAPAGGAVLLSPACSSYDQFNNYEERGVRFRTLVEAR